MTRTNVLRGAPSQMAVLVNNTNLSSAAWTAYNPSITVTLPTTEGRCPVLVGLRGLSPDSLETWETTFLTFDVTPPSLVLTNPISLPCATSKPLLQVQGYSLEPLSAISYDINNAAGAQTGLPGFVTHQIYETNLHVFTTNFFQCFDIDLGEGDNTITLHATDLAGNAAVRTILCTVNRDTDPPVITPRWPTDGALLCGASFTLDGRLDDPTASITVNLQNGATGTNFAGVVERDGRFWLENLPLGDGTTTLSITATDPWANSATAQFSVTKSPLELSIVFIDPAMIYRPRVSVWGAGNNLGYIVRVNGVLATDDGWGNWHADSVPVPAGGTATFNVAAYPPGHDLDAAYAHQVAADVDQPDRLFVDTACKTLVQDDYSSVELLDGDDFSVIEWAEHEQKITWQNSWSDGGGGTISWTYDWNSDGTAGPHPYHCEGGEPFLATKWPEVTPAGGGYGCDEILADPFMVSMEQCTVSDPTAPWDSGPVFSTADPYFMQWIRMSGHASYDRTAATTAKLYTGRKHHRTERLFGIYVFARKVLDKRALPPFPAEMTSLVDTDKTKVGALGSPGSDYSLYQTLPVDATIDVTVQAKGETFYDYYLVQQPYDLDLSANGVTLDPETPVDNATFCVGENVLFQPVFTPSLPSGTEPVLPHWILEGEFKNQITPPSPSDASPTYVVDQTVLDQVSTHAWWISGAFDPVTYKAKFGEGLTFPNGKYAVVAVKGTFRMHRPSLSDYAWEEGNGKVTAALEHWNHAGEPAPPRSMPARVRDKLTVEPGAYYSVNINLDPKFTGGAISTQIVNGDMFSGETATDTHGLDYLDTSEIYAGMVFPIDSAHRLIWFRDLPMQVCAGITDIHLDFMTFVRFKPDNGPGPNIWATLGFVHWHVYESTYPADIGDGNGDLDFTPFPPSGEIDLPIYVHADPGTADIDEWISSANIFPWWFHTAVP